MASAYSSTTFQKCSAAGRGERGAGKPLKVDATEPDAASNADGRKLADVGHPVDGARTDAKQFGGLAPG
jgi:hypothetical protein